jgi:hypothetical protein
MPTKYVIKYTYTLREIQSHRKLPTAKPCENGKMAVQESIAQT